MARFRPFMAGEAQVGWVRHELARQLARYDDVFAVDDRAVRLRPALADFEARSRAMAEIGARLVEAGVFRKLRGEDFPVMAEFGRPPLFKIDRIAVPAFGLKASGVHMNGFLRKPDGLHLWLGRRAKDKSVAPGKLDHLVAGGQPHGLGIRQNLIKECAEEAGMPAALAGRAHPVGAITILAEEDGGLWHETLFNYDLTLSDDFVPRNTDGEVESFELMSVAEVRQRLESSDDFLFDVVPLLANCLMRHGHLSADDPDYVPLAELLAAEPNLAGSGL